MDNLPMVSTFDEIQKLGEVFERSGMFGCSQQGQGTVLVLHCIQAKMTPMEFIQTFHIIDGRPSMRSDAMLAKLLQFGGSYEVVERSENCASINAHYKSAQYGARLTWDEARVEPFTHDKHGKVKYNWATPRSRMQMLWARVVSDAVRTVCPLVCSGSYTPEETEDLAITEHVPERAALSTPIDVRPEEIDYTVVPHGRLAGTSLTELTRPQLLYMAGWDKISPAHRAAAKLELENRKVDPDEDETDHTAENP